MNLIFLFKFKFNDKYGFLFERLSIFKIGNEEKLYVSFVIAHRYTNFTVNVFDLSTTHDDSFKFSDKHTVRIYRYWCYDNYNNSPIETIPYLKLIKMINEHNPKPVKDDKNLNFLAKRMRRKRKNSNEDEKAKPEEVANYVIHSENSTRISTFILYDHIYDEIHKSSRVTTESAFKMFKTNVSHKNRIFDPARDISLVKMLLFVILAFR